MYARRLLVDSVCNMRDLGGYATYDGKITRFKRFIRSAAPLELSDGGLAYLKDFGVKYVFDLRTPHTAERLPCALRGVPGVEYYNISFADDPILESNFFWPMCHYVQVLSGPNRVCEILSRMADCADGAIFFHCAFGKDRTGIIAAFLLMLANVPREDIIADYQVSFTYAREFIKNAISRDRPIALCRTDAEWLEPMLKLVDDKGGIEPYLLGIGLTPWKLERLRRKLV